MQLIERNPVEDQRIMSGLVKRDPAALQELHARYASTLRAIIMKVMHDDAESDDVLQEVFLQVWDRAESYSADRGDLVSWLATLARRRAIDRLRQRCAYRRATDRYEDSCKKTGKEQDEFQPVERQVNRHDLRKVLARHLKKLPDAQSKAIRLAYLESKSQREISQLTGAPLGTVKTRIELGMKKLSESFSGMRAKVL
jgi:RNA polymerase sigma-70 factor, ECF subfamily